jgi:2-polyprenyl-6-methoxyphenol hydroxylase-like FAD-dependent oxidoreductase
VLIGADGWFSRIRQQLIGDGPPSFKNSVVWRARTKRPDWMPANDTKWFVPAANVHPGSILAVLIPVPGDEMVWQCHSPLDILAEKGVVFDPVNGEAASSHGDTVSSAPSTSSSGRSNAEVIKERCLKVFKSFPEEFSSVVAATPAASITEHGLYQRAPDQIPLSNWGSGPVTLVGDAAHTAFVDGTGMGLSFEDAAVLGLKVKELGLGEEALRAYEEERGGRVRAVFEMQAKHGQMIASGKATQQELVPERNGLMLGVEFKPLGTPPAKGMVGGNRGSR